MRRSPVVSGMTAAVASAALAAIAVTWAIGPPMAARAERGSFASQGVTPARPLNTAFLDPAALGGPGADAGFRRVRQAGATFVRVMVNWGQVAPGGQTKPAAFDARNPADPLYRWAELDRQIRAATRKGLTPLVYVQAAPSWAQSGRKLRPND
jgi:predicted DNA-binding WGR domain protein